MELSKVETLARELLEEHGLDEGGWAFRWDRAKRRLGRCSFSERVISLSKPLAAMNDEGEVRDTILHEIAHALAGPGAGHGAEWKRVARAVGARPEARSATAQAVQHQWQGTCQHCGSKVHRHRLSAKAHRWACAKCCKRLNNNRWSADYLLRWQRVC